MKKKNNTKLNEKQKKFVDEIFKNGFNNGRAYQLVYGIENPNYADASASRLLNNNENVKNYYDFCLKKHREKLNIDKQKMLDMLVDELNLFNEMKILANKEKLTSTESERFNRLSILLKASDANKTRDMVNKLIGAYEPEKQEVTHKWKVGFGYENSEEEEEK